MMPLVKDPKDYLEVSLREFFDNDENTSTMLKIIHNELMSLRTLDWFVSNYSKKKNIMFTTSSGRLFNVFMEYKSQLKSYSKKMFDPFCRCKRIKFKGLDTTVGQLNFFEWVISDEILAHLETHREAVHADMESRLQELKDTTDKDTRRKRHELSNSATNILSRHNVTVKVSFE